MKPRKPLLFILIAVVVAALAVGFQVYVDSRETGSGDDKFTSDDATHISGLFTCLPHKSAGPSTLECAYGLKSDSGKYYALADLTQEAQSTPMNVRVQVTGLYEPVKTPGTYDINGTIRVKVLERL